MQQAPTPKLYDIAANLTDDQFSGKYHSKSHHQSDIAQVILRSRQHGCQHLLIAAGNIEDALKSTQICSQYQQCYATIGVHPCRAKEPFNRDKWASVDEYFLEIQRIVPKMGSHLVAIGECGLDYDRLEWSTKEEQLEIFPYHFALAEKYKLPMYLHNRNTGNDFFNIVAKNRDRFSTGVVHSFTGPKSQLDRILELDLYIGINGCSLKTAQNLQTLKHVPLDRLMLETDSPYCEIKKTHASYEHVVTKFQAKPKQKKKPGQLVKGRNQPCRIVEVLEVVSKVMGVPQAELATIVLQNSLKVLGPRK